MPMFVSSCGLLLGLGGLLYILGLGRCEECVPFVPYF